VRNPIFAAMIPAFVGVALLAPNALSIAGAVVLVVALELQTRLVEEPYLLAIHGERYALYARRVGRFLPRVGTVRG
jgi:protein-S-isoprenylcysteine O-methyltransferase Ste14